jgi:hypothetical protein
MGHKNKLCVKSPTSRNKHINKKNGKIEKVVKIEKKHTK